MKNNSGLVLGLTFISVVTLLVASLYFGAPLFGWVIIAFIFLIFIGSALRDYRLLKTLETESIVLAECEKSGNYENVSQGFVGERLLAVKSLGTSLQSLSTQASLELLNAKLALRCGKNAGGVVILLGLMGTFFGLMLSVSTAGSTIDNSSSVATMNSIQGIFSNMKGIFGTSLCGIFASLVLSFIHSLVEKKAEIFASELDLWTVSKLFPTFVSGGKNQLSAESDSWKQIGKTLEDSNSRLAETFEKTVALMESQTRGLLESVKENSVMVQKETVSMVKGVLNEMQSGMAESWKVSASRVEVLESGVGEKLQEAIVSLTEKITLALQNQTEKAKEEWNVLLKRFSDMADSGLAVEESRLEKLRNSSLELSDSISKELQQIGTQLKEDFVSFSENMNSRMGGLLENSTSQWQEFMRNLSAKSEETEQRQMESIKTVTEAVLQVAEKSNAGSIEMAFGVTAEIQKLSNEVQTSFAALAENSSKLVETQGRLIEEIENRVVRENEATTGLSEGILEAASLMRVNQSEFAAGLEMFNKGLEALFEKLSGETEEKEEEEFLDQIRRSLEMFHERSSEILVENAVKTQEILLEILEQTQRSAHFSEKNTEA